MTKIEGLLYDLGRKFVILSYAADPQKVGGDIIWSQAGVFQGVRLGVHMTLTCD